jgi:hypothetical protein
VWAAIHPDDLQRAYAVWHEPEYADLRLDGFLSNPVKPWDLLYAPVSLEVRDPEHTPYDRQVANTLAELIIGGLVATNLGGHHVGP